MSTLTIQLSDGMAARLLQEARRRNVPEDAIVEKELTQDAERVAWLAQGESRLREVWDNDADDAYQALLAANPS